MKNNNVKTKSINELQEEICKDLNALIKELEMHGIIFCNALHLMQYAFKFNNNGDYLKITPQTTLEDFAKKNKAKEGEKQERLIM